MSNTGITLVDVREEAMATIQKLKSNEMDVKTAGEIRNLLATIIDTAKVQVSFMNALPNSVKEQMSEESIKAIAGTLKDRDAELDLSLSEIERNKNTYK
jgi:hypothetical protein